MTALIHPSHVHTKFYDARHSLLVLYQHDFGSSNDPDAPKNHKEIFRQTGFWRGAINVAGNRLQEFIGDVMFERAFEKGEFPTTAQSPRICTSHLYI